ncbi:MAG: KamA family radical SAM protein [Thermoguttaceae bacterium]|nr:KamA family radical SAM protein [Thermoguttaceae bacterium]
MGEIGLAAYSEAIPSGMAPNTWDGGGRKLVTVHGEPETGEEPVTDWPEQIPAAWRHRMRKVSRTDDWPEDPLWRQCAVSRLENEPSPPGFSTDPLAECGESRFDVSNDFASNDSEQAKRVMVSGETKVSGNVTESDHVAEVGEPKERSVLLKKYVGRALILTEAGCGIHCRFCFRRHQQNKLADSVGGDLETGDAFSSSMRSFQRRFTAAAEVIRADVECTEVILSGGDPLMQSDTLLAWQYATIAAIPHVKRMRIHTRIPVVLPARITDALCRILVGSRLRTVVVLHVNHPNEIDPILGGEPLAAIERLVETGIPLLSQTTLLRGVNDAADTLATLMEMLINHRVIPYYLHQLDRVLGAAHFEVPVAEGCRIMKELRCRLPGYAVPRYVREIAGQPYKIPLE